MPQKLILFSASRITVIKGVQALAYAGSSLGGITLVEPGKISEDPHIHGLLNYHLESNGWGNTLNAQLAQKAPFGKWRTTITSKIKGDLKAPDYFLTNTGVRELNGSFQLEKAWSSNWKTELYISTFNTELGVLRGSHIGNLTDLEQAIGRDEPFFTVNKFSYQIDAPKQMVNHQLLKLKNDFIVNDHTSWNITYAAQLNNRKEFDVRRSGRSDIPALSLTQYDHFFEAQYAKDFENPSFIKLGIQSKITDNTNNPETGIFPLIPDYLQWATSLFAIYQYEQKNWTGEAGIRYDYLDLNVVTFDKGPQIKIVRYDHQFHNMNYSVGATWAPQKSFILKSNFGYVLRAPAVNELYSAGLHQGVSGIEEGDRFLQTEKSLKGTLSSELDIKQKVFVNLIGYYQKIDEYIYLQPEEEFRLTIRGAFPVFTYQQTQAEIYGVDAFLSFEPNDHMIWKNKFSFVRGWDIKNRTPLLFIPPLNASSEIEFRLNNFGNFLKNEISFSADYTAQQNNLFDNQDFFEAPDSYLLFNGKLSTQILVGNKELNLAISANNIFNTTYRDYLNRLRYFADNSGRNLIFNAGFSF